MQKIAWLTDLHLVFLRDKKTLEFDPEYFDFLDSVTNSGADAVLITGDIGDAPELSRFLNGLADAWKRPVYFVLGNHDFYHSSIASVRQEIVELCDANPLLNYVSNMAPISLSADTGLVGHDGWPDGRSGNYVCSDFKTNDFVVIQELCFQGRNADDLRLPVMQRLADEAAEHLKNNLQIAVERFRKLFVITHFPPYPQSAMIRGKLVDELSAPLTVCTVLGDVILEAAHSAPECEFIVLCGHTHESCIYEPLSNVRVITGAAEYFNPTLQRLFDL